MWSFSLGVSGDEYINWHISFDSEPIVRNTHTVVFSHIQNNLNKRLWKSSSTRLTQLCVIAQHLLSLSFHSFVAVYILYIIQIIYQVSRKVWHLIALLTKDCCVMSVYLQPGCVRWRAERMCEWNRPHTPAPPVMEGRCLPATWLEETEKSAAWALPQPAPPLNTGKAVVHTWNLILSFFFFFFLRW